MAYSYKGAITFGLIYIPITLHVVIKNNDISFHLIDKKTNTRIMYKKTCVGCDEKEVEQEDIVKAYEYESGKYVQFNDEDFKKVKSKKDSNITIMQFIDINEIDPIYYDKAYYVVPTGADYAFNLLILAMEQQKKAGIAKCVMGFKENLILIRAQRGIMLLNTLYFDEEVQKNPRKEVKVEIKEKELELAKNLIESMSQKFKIEEFKDEYRQKIQNAIESKIAGKQIITPKEEKTNKVINLMDALLKSLENNKKLKADLNKERKKVNHEKTKTA